MPVPGTPCGARTGPLPLTEECNMLQKRSWNSQDLCGWARDGETLTPEQIHTEEVMLAARTDCGPIPECDWFNADDIIPTLL